MLHALRRRSALFVIATLVLAGGVSRLLPPGETSVTAAEPDDAAGVRIEYRAQVGELYHYVIENEVIDDVAIYTQQFRLPSTTTFRDRRTIIQSVLPAPAQQPAGQNPPPASAPADAAKNDNLLRLEWVVDRYSASERVTDMKEVAFDSLRDTYPMRELSGLARVPQSRTTFTFNGKTGTVSDIVVKPGPVSHPSDSRQSKTAENGLVTTQNMQDLLYNMGEQFLPDGPKRVGDTWLIEQEKQTPPFGTVITKTTCTLKSIQKSGNAEIALIDLTSKIFFTPSPPKAPPGPPIIAPPTTRPTTTMPRHPAATPIRPPPTTQPATRAQPLPKPGASKPATPGNARTQPPSAPQLPLDQIGSPNIQSTPPTTQSETDAQAGVSNPPATTQPASQPAANSAPKNSEEPFKMEKALFTGTVRFDVTHGRLVELTMRRTGGFVKVMRSDKEEMKIKQASAHTLRIKGSVDAPARPVIPGGPKPPEETVNPNAKVVPPVTTRPTTPAAAALNSATTQPAKIRAEAAHRIHATSRPTRTSDPNSPMHSELNPPPSDAPSR